VLFAVLMTCLIAYLVYQVYSPGPAYLDFGYIGFSFGAGVIVAILGGLLGRSWLVGLFSASLATALWFAVHELVFLFGYIPQSVVRGSDGKWEYAWMLFLLPLIVFETSFVFLLGRALLGLRLSFGCEEKTMRGTMGIEELFLLTICIASMISGCLPQSLAMHSCLSVSGFEVLGKGSWLT
jgi:hypothetical protein